VLNCIHPAVVLLKHISQMWHSSHTTCVQTGTTCFLPLQTLCQTIKSALVCTLNPSQPPHSTPPSLHSAHPPVPTGVLQAPPPWL
jgi:hypothetical protein